MLPGLISKRYVIDTNVLVSALLLEQSTPARVVFHLLANDTILTSLSALQELEAVLHRPKFDRYVALEEREAFITKFALTAETINSMETVQACRDPKDDRFLEIAVNGEARVIVTGDPDLLALLHFEELLFLREMPYSANLRHHHEAPQAQHHHATDVLCLAHVNTSWRARHCGFGHITTIVSPAADRGH